MKRTHLNKNSLELMLWTLIETVPRVIQLGSLFFFLVDIEDYFEKDPTKVNGAYQPIALSVAIDLGQFYIRAFWNTVDFWLAVAYNWVVFIFTEYISYVRLIEGINNYIYTPVWTFFFSTIFQLTPSMLKPPTAEDP